MHPSETMEETIDGKVYRVKSATLIADDEYWDGHNFEHGGTNAFLYKTPKGNYFTVHLTQWEGSRDNISPITKEEAKEQWDSLPEKRVSYEVAFEEKPEEA